MQKLYESAIDSGQELHLHLKLKSINTNFYCKKKNINIKINRILTTENYNNKIFVS